MLGERGGVGGGGGGRQIIRSFCKCDVVSTHSNVLQVHNMQREAMW